MINDWVAYEGKILGSFKNDSISGEPIFVAESPKDLTLFLALSPSALLSLESYEGVVTKTNFSRLKSERFDRISASYSSLNEYIGRNFTSEERKKFGLD